MRDTAFVVRRRHPVMHAQCIIPLRKIAGRFGREVAERCRQAVTAMFQGRAPGRPKRILQPFCQRDMALAAQNDMGVFEARPDKPEVVETVIEYGAGNGYAQLGHIRKIRQALSTRFVNLPEYHFAFRAVKSTPAADPALQRAPDPGRQLRMTSAHLLVNRNRPQTGCRLQERHDFGIEDMFQRIRTPPRMRRLGP